MDVFQRYAEYYDNIYKEKDYEKECDFIEEIFANFSKESVRSILDLGCGTAGHGIPLIQRGFDVTGIDFSPKMISIAREKAQRVDINIDLHHGDIRSVRLSTTFGAVISMFAVIGYQTTNEDVSDSLQTARVHLGSGGLFIFDCWFGPAVLIQNPHDRYLIIERDDDRIIRFAKPHLNVLNHTVRVDYKVIRIQDNVVIDEVDESHVMRFFFPKEIDLFLKTNGFSLRSICPFLKLHERPSHTDWNVAVIAEAI